MTSRGDEAARRQGLEVGANAYLLKNEFDQDAAGGDGAAPRRTLTSPPRRAPVASAPPRPDRLEPAPCPPCSSPTTAPTLRRIVSSVLTREGYEVVQAEDGVEAVQAAFRHQPDVIVLDVQMPRVSGYVAARLLKDDWQTAQIPLVLLTSLDAASDRYWGAQTGADRYLTKDFEASELADAVAEVLAAAAQARGRRAGPAARPARARRRRRAVPGLRAARPQALRDLRRRRGHRAGRERAAAWSRPSPGCSGCSPGSSTTTWPRCCWPQEQAAYVAVARSDLAGAVRPVPQRRRRSAVAASGRAFAGLRRRPGAGARRRPRRPARRRPGGPARRRRRPAPCRPSPRCRCTASAVSWSGCSPSPARCPNAFGETALSTLKLIEGPAAVVIDNARLARLAAVG